MTTIYKYPLEVDITHNLPKGATFLSVQTQHDQPVMWFELDTSRPTEARQFTCYATGAALPPIRQKYLGTFQRLGGSLVYHLYEILP